MTLCIKTGYQCCCQPDEGVFCPDYKPDAYVQCLMDAIKELLANRPEGREQEPEPHSYALLKLEGAERPLFFVMEERYGSPGEEDYQENRRFFYESHSCPTNWLGSCVAVIEAGDADPHGFLTFVRSIPIPKKSAQEREEAFGMADEEDWKKLFPEAFGHSLPQAQRQSEDK